MITENLLVVGTWLAALAETQDFKEIATDLQQFDARFKVHKKLCLLQAAGANLGYTFHWDLYGPYSAELGQDLGAIIDPVYAQEIAARLSGASLNDTGRAKLARAKALFGVPSQSLGVSEDTWLEVVASLSFLKGLRGEKASQNDVVDELLSKKAHVARETAELAWQKLEAGGLI